MKIAYLNPVGGVSGDMLIAALLDGGGDEDRLLNALGKLSLPPWKWQRKEETRRGFGGSKIEFVIDAKTKQRPRHLPEIIEIIKDACFPTAVEDTALNTFSLLAEAEGNAHRIDREQLHFHEVGAADAILDICGVAFLVHDMALEKIFCSPLPMGSGSVTCAHGEIPLPAPALNELLRGVPVFGSSVRGETVTPTGLALLKALSCQFGDFPAMGVNRTGVGLGSRDFEVPNLLRVFIGEGSDTAAHGLFRLECTVDDMTGEELGFLWDVIYATGINDMYFTPIQMKKGRPGVKITVLTEGAHLEQARDALFCHTTTLGMTVSPMERFTLQRYFERVATPYGEVTYKCATGYGVQKAKAEYEDLKRIAAATEMPLSEIREKAEKIRIWEHDRKDDGKDED
ncbi:MAG TPA: nickel pincer cofactor biosynthesis protein LarC [Clostridiales bacterium]|nr:nickel pincer cofactor biosynthesis protein LarC [Clostridiales bacterium]